MKMNTRSTVLCVVFLVSFIFFLSEAAVPCSTVDMRAAACVGFATGKDAKPTATCCSGLQQLAQTVKTVDDKKAICRCLKAGAKSLGVQDKFLSQIPQACNIKVGFPVSISTNCETIH
ncbi:non-specific lipid-transfer protein C, cotyledon-specific isoform-like [Carica papaya]|uniref:non-specific lipid-transfer protein C, cotyledon-specific isoform-like n=1 Tax=Carica papaya TaxID=3649 RepID=UPI000B8C9381|nr:non-specific lipid-transfer protein C, cotyledon-specific isoform-like [Carica papaya]